MKFHVIFILLVWICGSARAEGERFVMFDGTKYFLASERGNDSEYLREYVPARQKISHWKMLVSVGTRKGAANAKTFVAHYLESVSKVSPLVGEKYVIEKDDLCIVEFICLYANYRDGERNIIKVVADDTGVRMCRWATQFNICELKDRRFDSEAKRLYGVIAGASFEEESEASPLLPTAPSGTSAAEQPRVPASAASHL
jgi:hypothetical protein